MGQYVLIEDRTSNGRIDLVIETGGYVYLFEFKVDSSADDAMQQIIRKKYWLKFLSSGKKIYLIGANFSTDTRNIDGYLITSPDEIL